MKELRIEADEAQVQAAQLRLRAAAKGGEIFKAFPAFKEVIDGLPNLPVGAKMPLELWVPVLDAFIALGVSIPLDTWKALNIEHFACKIIAGSSTQFIAAMTKTMEKKE